MVDELVRKALAKWPDVPALAGWLRLTGQGSWLLTGAVPQGLSISNERILNFISRNYDCDPQGRYFFQNGPQKVYVELAVTPWIYRIHPLDNGHYMLVSHTGLMVKPFAAYVDELGRLYFQTELGLGMLHGSDSVLLSDALEQDDEDEVMIRAVWDIPAYENDSLPLTRIFYRLAKNEKVGPVDLNLRLKKVASAQLPDQFGFVLKPEV